MSSSSIFRRAAALIGLSLATTVCGVEPVIAPPNACGGEATLVFDGAPALPGDPCGVCGDGSVVCDGPDALRCAAASERNACGGCAALEHAPETACTSGGLSGTWKCSGADEVACADHATGPCGGALDLEAVPGDPCGACGLGTYVCEGPDAVRCDGASLGLNACQTCGTLPAGVGDPCRECGGAWACDEDGLLVCNEPARNACGGCGALDAVPGAACDGGTWACTAEDTLECVTSSGPMNACGGESTLELLPGSSCGACGGGYVACAGAENVVCRDATPVNACGGCGPLQGEPGKRCSSTGWRWACGDDRALACVDLLELAELAIEVEPESLALAIGDTRALEAFAVGDGTLRFPITDEAIFASENASVAHVDEDGLVEALAAGKTTIVVSWQYGPTSLRHEVKVDVPAASTGVLSLTSASTRTPLGVPVALTATRTTGGQAPQDITSLVSWSVTPASAGSVLPDGRFHPAATGLATIEASLEGLRASVVIEVVPAEAVGLLVTPDSVALRIGDSRPLQATLRRSDDTEAPANAQWSSSNEAVVTVDAGVVTAVSVGKARVTAQAEGFAAYADVEVKPPPYTSLAVTADRVSTPLGRGVQLSASATRDGGAPEDVTALVEWTMAPADAGAVSSTGLFSAAKTGHVTITAVIDGLDDSVALEVTAAEPVALVLEPTALTMKVNETKTIVAFAQLTDDTLSEVTAVWTSSEPEMATVAGGLVTAVAPGNARLTALWEDFEAHVDVEVAPPALVSLSLLPGGNLNLGFGVCLEFFARGVFEDGAISDVTAQVEWTSSNAATASPQGMPGRFCVVGGGSTTIRVEMDGIQASLTVTGGAPNHTYRVDGNGAVVHRHHLNTYRTDEGVQHVVHRHHRNTYRADEGVQHVVHRHHLNTYKSDEGRNHSVHRP